MTTYTPNLNLSEPAFNSDVNTWGGVLNENFALIDQGVAGLGGVNLVAGPVTLTSAQSGFRIFNVVGALAASASIVLSSVTGIYRFINNTSGNFTVTVQNNGSDAGVPIAPGAITVILCNGANAIYDPSSPQPGTVAMAATASAPAGWTLCNGAALNRLLYAGLFANIGTTFGAGDGMTTFNAPDFRSRSPMGAGQGAGLSNRNLGATGGEELHVLLTTELATHAHIDSGHVHTITDPGHVHASTPGTGFVVQVTGTTGLVPASSGVNIEANTASATTGITGANSGTANIQTTGSNTGHNTVHPFLAINFIIKT